MSPTDNDVSLNVERDRVILDHPKDASDVIRGFPKGAQFIPDGSSTMETTRRQIKHDQLKGFQMKLDNQIKQSISLFALLALVSSTSVSVIPQQQETCYEAVFISYTAPDSCSCSEHFRLWESADSWCPGSSQGTIAYWRCVPATPNSGRTRCESVYGVIGELFQCKGRNNARMPFCAIFWSAAIVACITSGGWTCGGLLAGAPVSCMPCDTIKCYRSNIFAGNVFGLHFSKWGSGSVTCPPAGA